MKHTPHNPDPKCLKRVPPENRLPRPETCPDCAGKVGVLHHTKIYGGRQYGRWPWVYACLSCGARVGMHPGTDIPLGTLAGAALRRARIEGKKEFERIWQDGWMSRSEAYEWLADELGIDRSECHFGRFDAEKCRAADEACSAYMSEVGA